MSLWLQIAGWAVFGVSLLLTVAFTVTSLRERQWRAALVAVALGGVSAAGLAALLFLDFGGQDLWLTVVLSAGAVLLLVAALPLGPPPTVRVVGEQPQVDERDAFFHRFYRLEPGMAEYEAYYADRPEQETFDARVRDMPLLASPGSRGYDPRVAAVPQALNDVVERLNVDLDEPPVPPEGGRVELSPASLSRRLKEIALRHGAKLVGCTRLNPAYVYSHVARGPGEWGSPVTLGHRYAMAIAVEMRHDLVQLAPDPPVLAETTAQYLESAKVALVVARTLHHLGWEARAHVDANYRVMAVPIAVDAGLGELGRLGLLITPTLGPRVRLAVVTTDAPLEQDPPVQFGAAAFCEICKKCATGCPANAIAEGAMQVVAGVQKWQSRDDTCYRHWRTVGTDCALCLKVCPFSHPANPVHDLVRWAIARNGLTRRLALWGDDLCYGRLHQGRGRRPFWQAADPP